MKRLNVNLKWIPDVDGRPKIVQLVGYHLQDITCGVRGPVQPDCMWCGMFNAAWQTCQCATRCLVAT